MTEVTIRKSRVKKRSIKAGLPPGQLVYVGDAKVSVGDIDVFGYSPDNFIESKIKLKDLAQLADTKPAAITWINFNSVSDVYAMERVRDLFRIHPLIVEDIMNTDQRPKVEFHDDCVYIVMKMLDYNNKTQQIITEQVSFVLKDNCLLTFLEDEGDVFEQVRERIRDKKGQIRNRGHDYLVYSLLDAIVDQCFIINENLALKVEKTEEDVTVGHSSDMIRNIHTVKTELIQFRRHLLPMLELMRDLLREETPLLQKSTRRYFQDIYDHTRQITDMVETSREVTTHVLEVYMSQVSNKMNETMKILTIIATIFIPLTFIVGVYGMNFDEMPELHWSYGYPLTWILMLGVAVGTLVMFKRRKML